MNIIEFMTEDNEFKIRISKTRKFYATSEFGQFNCLIEFLNSMNIPVLQINCTEKELYSAVQKLGEFTTNIAYGLVSDDNVQTSIYFASNPNMESYYWNVYTTNLDTFPDDYPVEQDIMCALTIFSTNLGGSACRLYIELTYQFLESIIYNIYLILEDIPYLDKMNQVIIEEFLRGEYDGE